MVVIAAGLGGFAGGKKMGGHRGGDPVAASRDRGQSAGQVPVDVCEAQPAELKVGLSFRGEGALHGLRQGFGQALILRA